MLTAQAERWSARPDPAEAIDVPTAFSLPDMAERTTRLLDDLVPVTAALAAGDLDQLAPAFALGAAALLQVRRDPLLPAELTGPAWPGPALRAAYVEYQHAFATAAGSWFAAVRSDAAADACSGRITDGPRDHLARSDHGPGIADALAPATPRWSTVLVRDHRSRGARRRRRRAVVAPSRPHRARPASASYGRAVERPRPTTRLPSRRGRRHADHRPKAGTNPAERGRGALGSTSRQGYARRERDGAGDNDGNTIRSGAGGAAMTGGPADGGGSSGPVFDPPLSLPTPPPVEGEEGGHRKRVLWAFGAAAALFGAGIVGLSLPSNKDDGVNVKTDDTVGPTTTTIQAPTNDRTRSLVAPVFAPFTFSAAGVANTTTVPAGNPNGSLPSVSPKTLAALAGVVASGATTITLTPPPPVTNTPTPVVQNNNSNNPQPGTSAPGTSTGPTSPPTTKPPKPTTTTTTDPPTTTAGTDDHRAADHGHRHDDHGARHDHHGARHDDDPGRRRRPPSRTRRRSPTTTTTTVAATTTSFDRRRPTPAPTEPPTTPRRPSRRPTAAPADAAHHPVHDAADRPLHLSL